MTKCCLAAIDTPTGPVVLKLVLPVAATIAAALAEARAQLGAVAVDWERAEVGLWGVRCARSTVPSDGDRIELYRPLPADPRQRRRQRAELKGPAR